ncbi:hypothetical protein IM676_08465 [Anabaenopsis elenkinii CCIBt3563]|uniref:Uncharacterized protein n=1 Tax=Anabaenopsis elenkinii CCIBt3563 TaxID=2779889 RepID=A0A7S6U0C1_9CYAN|nr:hypothetical protein IM676_08465 [Anabaenopsis elenkinii CCIBt3563]
MPLSLAKPYIKQVKVGNFNHYPAKRLAMAEARLTYRQCRRQLQRLHLKY